MMRQAVLNSLYALDWQRLGYFYTFSSVGGMAAGTLVVKECLGTYIVDSNLIPGKRIDSICNRYLRISFHNAQLLCLMWTLDFRAPIVLSDPNDLWMIPLIIGFDRNFVFHGFKGDIEPYMKAGKVLRFFFTPPDRVALQDFKRLTMEQQELVVFLYHNYGCNGHNGIVYHQMNEDLSDFFKGMHFDHIFAEYNDDYFRDLRFIFDYYRRKEGQRAAYAAFFHGLEKEKDGVPQSEFRRSVGHGAGRNPIRKRVCAFLFL